MTSSSSILIVAGVFQLSSNGLFSGFAHPALASSTFLQLLLPSSLLRRQTICSVLSSSFLAVDIDQASKPFLFLVSSVDMAVFLPILSFLLLFAFKLGTASKLASLHVLLSCFIESLVVFSAAIFVCTEALSFFRLIGYWPLVAFYFILISALFAANVLLWLNNETKNRWFGIAKMAIAKHGRMILFLVAFLTFLFVTFLLYPPNTWDSMTYHLPRVEHWIQNKDLSYYPTSIDRQLFSQPFPEYVVLHMRLLLNNDYLAPLGQFISYIGIAVLVFLISRLLGIPSFFAIVGGIISLFVPMSILQATSTQTDLVSTFFLLAFIYFGLEYVHESALYSRALIFGSVSLGLTFLAKFSAGLFCFPFLLWFAIYLLTKKAIRRLITTVCFAAISVATINLPYFVRNFLACGSPVGDKSLTSEMRSKGSLFQSAFSNSIRNYAIQLNTPFDVFNEKVKNATIRILRLSRIDPENQQNTWGGDFLVYRNVGNEDSSGSLLIYIILPFSSIFVLLNRRRLGTDTFYFVLSAISGFVFFSAVLKWQPWGTRLMLPFSMLSCIVICVSLSLLSKQSASAIGVLFILAGLPFVFFNASRPMISVHIRPSVSIRIAPRPPFHSYEKYFTNKASAYHDYDSVLSKGYSSLRPRQVLLSTGEDSWEYPLWLWFRIHAHPMPLFYTPLEYARFVPRGTKARDETSADWFLCIQGKEPGPEWAIFSDSPSVKLFFRKTATNSRRVGS